MRLAKSASRYDIFLTSLDVREKVGSKSESRFSRKCFLKYFRVNPTRNVRRKKNPSMRYQSLKRCRVLYFGPKATFPGRFKKNDVFPFTQYTLKLIHTHLPYLCLYFPTFNIHSLLLLSNMRIFPLFSFFHLHPNTFSYSPKMTSADFSPLQSRVGVHTFI
jgi:hypothetical protein